MILESRGRGTPRARAHVEADGVHIEIDDVHNDEVWIHVDVRWMDLIGMILSEQLRELRIGEWSVQFRPDEIDHFDMGEELPE